MEIIRLDYRNCLNEKIGSEGLKLQELKTQEKKFVYLKKNLEKKKEYLAFSILPGDLIQAKEIKKLALKIRNSGNFENFVVIGIGGSALGNRALQETLNHPYWNLLPREKRKGWLRLFVLDNIDPQVLKGTLEILDLRKTIFNVISKSGETVECLANFFILKDALIRKVGKKYYQQIIVTTDEKKGYLRETVEKEKFLSFVIPEGLGGRFSVLSPVGLVSAAFTGIDIEEILLGAEKVKKVCSRGKIFENPAVLYALLQYLFYQKGKKISVMLAYGNGLYALADWFRQLWAESLGKSIKVGPTPIKALGVTDQHSQLQLYLEGPKDKIITFLSVEKILTKVLIPQVNDHFLGGKTLNQLFSAEEEATRQALTLNQRPNCRIALPEISPSVIGQLIYFFELATAYAGELFQVNAFNQPAVELIKKYTKEILNHERN